MTGSIRILTLIVLLPSCADAQNRLPDSAKLVGGPCEGCEAVFEFGTRKLSSVDTLPGFNDKGLRIKVTGTIFKTDGKSPARDVILYIYHTDQKGVYATRGDETGWARRHGYLRGWVKTGADGKYTFYTLKPGTYPDGTAPAHIHPTILEPEGKYYWIESYHFAGDSLLTEQETTPAAPRGGSSGLVQLKKEGDIFVGRRDIILGANIDGHE